MKGIKCLMVITLALALFGQVGYAESSRGKLPDCQLPFPVHYYADGRPGVDCTRDIVESIIAQAIDMYNTAAREDLELPFDFFYYAGTTASSTALCDCGENNNACDYVNGINQIVWKTNIPSIGRTCWCRLNDGYEMDITLHPDKITCGTPDETHVGCLSTVLHELGHVLGLLDAPGCTESVMNYIGNNESLAECDIEDLWDLYLPTYPVDPFSISNVNVSTTFNSSTYTWQATFTFETNLPAIGKVSYDPSMDCYPTCSYSLSQSGPADNYKVDHEIVVNNLVPSTTYCYKIEAVAGPDPAGACLPYETGSFSPTNSYNPIYSIVHSFKVTSCQIGVAWTTKFPSKNNKLYHRKSGESTWQIANASGGDCRADRKYSAAFSVQENSTYEFKVCTQIDGTTYYSDVMTRQTQLCDGGIETSGRPGAVAPPITVDPNPCNPSTVITINVVEDSQVDLAIYAVDGRLVRTLASERYAPGVHRIRWDGSDAAGKEVSSGIYFAKLGMGAANYTAKIVLVR